MDLSVIILIAGDQSVGIPDAYFEMDLGIPALDAYEIQRADFRAKLAEAFRCIGDNPKVFFSDELPTSVDSEDDGET